MSPGGGGSRQAAVWVPGHFYGHDVLGPALLPERLGRWADGTLPQAGRGQRQQMLGVR